MRVLLLLSAFFVPSAFVAQDAPDLAASWRASGRYFSWVSSAPENHGKAGLLADELKSEFRLCVLDFPGYGFSDKPSGDYRYSLKQDAELVWHFVTEVARLRTFSLLSHDRGDSVALSFLELYQADPAPPFRMTHQYILNGNMYLPLANLTPFQVRMLDPSTRAALVKTVTPTSFAAGLGASTYTPALKGDDPAVGAMATMFAYQSGIEALPATIQYLNERKQMEVAYLQVLARSSLPVTLIWGVHDMIAPVRVADYVWNTAVRTRKAPGAFWIVPCGNHYVQHDQPQAVAQIIRLALGNPGQAAPYNLTSTPCAPVLIARDDQSTGR
jgi:pimeloyl-ACP methyl ester carboxylesterase